MAIEVIKARTKQQIEQGFAVREQTMVYGEGVPYDVEFDDDSAENPVYFLALSDGETLGTCRAVKIDARENISAQSNAAVQGNAFGWADAAAVEEWFADTVKLERIAVLSNRQHGGIGTALINGAEDILRREGVKKIIINSRDKALGFYERLEYRRMSAAEVEYCLALLPKVSRYEAKNRCGAEDTPNTADSTEDAPNTADNTKNAPNAADNAKNMPDTADNAGNLPNNADNVENALNTAGNVHSASDVQQNAQTPDCVDDRGFPGYLVEHIL